MPARRVRGPAQLQAAANLEAQRVDLDEFVVHHVRAVELPAVPAEPGAVRHGPALELSDLGHR
ncbi:MAG: hypothetical protein F4210_02285 [Holophagales bacterium]|nr:hypothetical protein [Holophagales bacterium]